MKTEVEQVNISDLGLWFGKMYPELLAQTKAQTSEQCYKKQSASSAKKPPIFLCLKTAGPQPAPSLEWGGGLERCVACTRRTVLGSPPASP